MKKLRIAMIMSTNPSNTGGVREHILNLTSELKKLGHTIHIYGPSSSTHRLQSYTEIGDTFLVPVPNGNWGNVHILHKDFNCDLINDNNYDIVHIHEPYIPFAVWILMQKIKSPMVATFHSAWDKSSIVSVLNYIIPSFKKAFSKLFHGAIFVSKVTKKRWIKLCGPRIHTQVIHNAVNQNVFNPVKLSNNPPLELLFVGRLVPRKGIMDLLKAYRKSLRFIKHTHLSIIGHGPQEKEVRDFIVKHRLSDHITFLGEIYDDKRSVFFQKAHIFCAPYRDEAGPLTIYEALSAGCIIVGYKNDSMNETLARYPGKSLLVSQNKNKLASAIIDISTHAEKRRTLRKWCVKEGKKYSWEKSTKKTELFYYTILKNIHSHD